MIMGEKRAFRGMLYHVIYLSVLVIAGSWAAAPVRSASIPIENTSFEAPTVDPNGFPAVPYVDKWTEVDLDTLSSTNTGVFANTPTGSPDHIVNADGSQLAFLGSQSGNALEQDLDATYKVGCDYRLTVAVGVSWRFPPSAESPADTLELVLYYLDGNEPVDIVSQTVTALPWSQILQDFSVYLPTVSSDDAWAGKNIGVALRSAGLPGGFWDLDNVRLIESLPVWIPIENASFEAPAIDPNGFPAVPYVHKWMEIDMDTLSSTNTGVFANTQAGSPDHIINADGSQLAFLGSQTGNALEQDLAAMYKIGCDYQLTVAVGVCERFPPSSAKPVDAFELVLYYRDANEPEDIVRQTVEAAGLSVTELTDVSLYLPTVQPGNAWAGMAIGVALRATGMPGGFWDIDNVRLIEPSPVSIPIENASFESPTVDPNGFPAVPYVHKWIEIDMDTLSSTNTGVFTNTPPGSPDHIVNAHRSQLAFLGSQTGNALEQDLAATDKIGCDYQLTVAVGVSGRFPPSSAEPVDTFELVLYYRDVNDPVDIVHQAVEATGLSVTQLTDVSLYLPTVQPSDACAGMAIGVALRATGMPGGFWDLDHVRLIESFPGPELALTAKE